MLGLAHTVSLARVPHHDRRHADVLERDVVLLRLGNRHVVVVFAVDHHRGRAHVRHVLQRGVFPQNVHQISLMRKRAPLHLLVLVVIRHVVVADEVGDAGSQGSQNHQTDQQGRERHEHIHEACDGSVDLAPVVSRKQTERYADNHPEEHRGNAHKDGDLAAQ